MLTRNKALLVDRKVVWPEKKATDSQKVQLASAWLGISEFQVFCDAWQAWYNENPQEKRIEPIFIRFLGEDSVPFWVRNYVRVVLNRKDLQEKEKKRQTVSILTYYVPLLFFFILLMWALL